MFSLDNQTMIMLATAAIANIIILYLIIANAVKADRRDKYLRSQINILALIAKKQGVSNEELEKAIEK